MIDKKSRVKNNNLIKQHDNCLPYTINVTYWRKSRSKLAQIEQNQLDLDTRCEEARIVSY